MSGDNGVIRIGRKGRRKFAFGEDGQPFEVDVVVALQEWICIDEQFRQNDARDIALADMVEYHHSAVVFAERCANSHLDEKTNVTTSEALDFIARLRECYDEVVVFFQPKSREKRDSPDSSGAELQFSEEES